MNILIPGLRMAEWVGNETKWAWNSKKRPNNFNYFCTKELKQRYASLFISNLVEVAINIGRFCPVNKDMNHHAPYLFQLLTTTCTEIEELQMKGAVRLKGEKKPFFTNIPILWVCFMQMYLYDRTYAIELPKDGKKPDDDLSWITMFKNENPQPETSHDPGETFFHFKNPFRLKLLEVKPFDKSMKNPKRTECYKMSNGEFQPGKFLNANWDKVAFEDFKVDCQVTKEEYRISEYICMLGSGFRNDEEARLYQRCINDKENGREVSSPEFEQLERRLDRTKELWSKMESTFRFLQVKTKPTKNSDPMPNHIAGLKKLMTFMEVNGKPSLKDHLTNLGLNDEPTTPKKKKKKSSEEDEDEEEGGEGKEGDENEEEEESDEDEEWNNVDCTFHKSVKKDISQKNDGAAICQRLFANALRLSAITAATEVGNEKPDMKIDISGYCDSEPNPEGHLFAKASIQMQRKFHDKFLSQIHSSLDEITLNKNQGEASESASQRKFRRTQNACSVMKKVAMMSCKELLKESAKAHNSKEQEDMAIAKVSEKYEKLLQDKDTEMEKLKEQAEADKAQIADLKNQLAGKQLALIKHSSKLSSVETKMMKNARHAVGFGMNFASAFDFIKTKNLQKEYKEYDDGLAWETQLKLFEDILLQRMFIARKENDSEYDVEFFAQFYSEHCEKMIETVMKERMKIFEGLREEKGDERELAICELRKNDRQFVKFLDYLIDGIDEEEGKFNWKETRVEKNEGAKAFLESFYKSYPEEGTINQDENFVESVCYLLNALVSPVGLRYVEDEMFNFQASVLKKAGVVRKGWSEIDQKMREEVFEALRSDAEKTQNRILQMLTSPERQNAMVAAGK